MKRGTEEQLCYLRGLFAQQYAPTAAQGDVTSAPSFIFASAPGRVELAGNHTDHQGGHTLSAAIDQRIYALAAENGTNEIRVYMDGFGALSLSILDLAMRPEERLSSLSLIRGMAAAFVEAGNTLRGFTMVTCSDIPVGCGVSSSAAFEVLVGTVLRALFGGFIEAAPGPVPGAALSSVPGAGLSSAPGLGRSVSPLDLTALALEGMQTEQRYFGKPCGAQDQLASAYGGIVALDFSGSVPLVTPVRFDAASTGFVLCLIDSHCDHSRYTDEFAAIPADMHAVAQHFNCTRLGDVPYPTLLAHLGELRSRLGDRAVLRALHFFEEDQRVLLQQQALEAHDFASFLEYVRLSGASSAQYLQSVSPHADVTRSDQPAMIILALCAHLLEGNLHDRGAYRIHGGGFGGSVLAFVPNEQINAFSASMNAALGYDACMPLSISAQGALATRVF